MRVSDNLREEILRAVVMTYTIARNGIPAEPRTAEEANARFSISRTAYMHNCQCRATVDKATHHIMSMIEKEG